MIQVYSKLLWVSLTPEDSEQRMGYKYLVTQIATPHIAFRKRSSLLRWAEERNLIIGSVPEEGIYGRGWIQGSYAKRSWMDEGEFFEIEALQEVRVMDNGEYVTGRITNEIIGGVRMAVVNYLNVNVHSRHVFDYHESHLYYG